MADTSRENAFAIAAAKVDVDVLELKLWLMEAKEPSPVQWSHWKSNRQAIPAEDLVNFMMARRSRGPLVAKVQAELSGLTHLEQDLRNGIEGHLSRQIDLLVALAKKIDELATLVLGGKATPATEGPEEPPPEHRQLGDVREKAAVGRRKKPPVRSIQKRAG